MTTDNKQFTKNILFLITMFTENILESYPTMRRDLPMPVPVP